MKRVFYLLLIIALLLSGVSPIWAQTAGGMDFWLTFGKNSNITYLNPVDLQIRVVSGDEPVTGIIYFTNLKTSITFSMGVQEVYTYNLNNTEKQAVYNTTTGIFNRSIHVISDKMISVFALNQYTNTTDATNVLPVKTLGDDYYHMSYMPASTALDAYAVIAIKDGTQIYHDGILVATLSTGQVYYRTFYSDRTGAHITANSPVAFFALSQGVQIPNDTPYIDCLMQQLAPVNTWGKNFFVPVSDLVNKPHSTDTKDRVRIVASENGTNITQTGGELKSATGSQMSLTNLQAGQFVELEVGLNDNGCFIQSDKPVGVCAYLMAGTYNNPEPYHVSDPAQGWLAPIEQTVAEALTAPFIPAGTSALNKHCALVITPTATKNNTRVSIGGSTPVPLSGGTWRDNAAANMSFYNMQMTNATASYLFTNDKGLIIMSYGIGERESYYYLASAAMRNLKAAFYANDIYYQDLPDYLICASTVDFRAEITEMDTIPGSLKWYINEKEEIAAQDQVKWSKNFPPGEYVVRLWTRFANNETMSTTSTLNIGVLISASASPPEGGSIEGDGCHRADSQIDLIATPSSGYNFISWTIDGVVVSNNRLYTLKATKNVTLTANFFILDFDTYAPTLWNNTFMLNLRKLKEKGYAVTGCKWYKNGIEETDTRTIDEFSYSAGPNITDLLETAPTWYMFELITSNRGNVSSSHKTFEYKPIRTGDSDNLVVYPNPTLSGNSFTVEGIAEGCMVQIYNQYGICISSHVATGNTIALTLNNVQAGTYLIRANEKQGKVVVLK